MGCELGVKTSAKAIKRKSMVNLDAKLPDQLAVDGLNHEASGIEWAMKGFRELKTLVHPWQGQKLDGTSQAQVRGDVAMNVGFVTDDGEV